MTEHIKGIITLFEQYGAGAQKIGPAVAEKLGLPWIGQRISSEDMEAADKEAAREARGVDRFLRSVPLAASMDADHAHGSNALSDYDLVMDNTRQVLESVKDEGGVILGRNATVILARAPKTMHVRLVAPVETRIQRAAADANIDEARAQLRQEREDRVRADISEQLYHWDVADDRHYDLVINTGTFSVDQTAALIVDAFQSKFGA